MIRAVWNGTVLAEAPRTVRIEGNHYFPPETLRKEHFSESRTKTLCPWKGVASYYDVSVGDDVLYGAAWYYARPTPLARRIKNHVAFAPYVSVEGEPEPKPGGERGGLRRLFGRAGTP